MQITGKLKLSLAVTWPKRYLQQSVNACLKQVGRKEKRRKEKKRKEKKRKEKKRKEKKRKEKKRLRLSASI